MENLECTIFTREYLTKCENCTVSKTRNQERKMNELLLPSKNNFTVTVAYLSGD